MQEDTVILLAEDDDGHATLTRLALREVGVSNPIIRFRDGQETIDFLFGTGQGPSRQADVGYLLLLDLRMPKVGGIAVLRRIRQDGQLRRMPVVVLSTTDNPHEIDTCKELNCNCYIVKPAGNNAFAEALRQVRPFLEHRQAPRTTGDSQQR
jgi:CheY-like chemotaxis protein